MSADRRLLQNDKPRALKVAHNALNELAARIYDGAKRYEATSRQDGYRSRCP
jgi:hypothetical protein